MLLKFAAWERYDYWPRRSHFPNSAVCTRIYSFMLNQVLGGRYNLLRHLGGGGFGQTYLAAERHLPGNPQCVVKQLKPKVSVDAWQTARRLFNTEAEVLYVLGNHDQIPRLFAHFEENQEFYLVQEFVEGTVLSQEFKQGKALSETEVVELLQEILTVLEFVHQQQVIHRDIKPSNLIRRGSDGKVILIDFGAVKQIEIAQEGETGTIAVGSSGYMPNEQLAGKPSFSSDIYAVGMIGIQALTGVSPRKLREDPKTSEILWREGVEVSLELADILDVMVRYDFRQRYQTAAEALSALKELNSGFINLIVPPGARAPIDEVYSAWLERGDELFQIQRYREAIAAYEKVILANPDDYVTWFKRGITLENLRQFEEALDAYDRVIALQPDDYLAWFKRGTVCENLCRFESALTCYEKVVQLQPGNYWAWHDRGKVLENLHRFEEAVEAYDRAVQVKPNFQLAVESRKRLLSQLKQVDALYDLQHYDAAIASCDRAIQQNPNDGLAWLMRGMALENQQNYEQAIVAYDRVVQIQPDDALAWFKRGAVLQNLRRYPEALTCYDQVVEFQSDHYWAWHDRGKVLEALQQFEEAMQSYDRAIQIKPDLQAAIDGRQRVLAVLQGNSPWEENSTVLPTTKPEIQASDDYGTWFQKGQVLEKLHHYTEAVMAYNKAMQLNPHDPEVLRWRGNVLFSLKRYEEAIGSYDKAIQLQPSNPHLWCCLASSLIKLKRYQEAAVCFDKAVQLQSHSHSTWYWRGRVLSEMKRYSEALRSYDRALEQNPDFQPAMRDREKLQAILAVKRVN
ncbi:tetratricopeptide repeat protein [Phormidesmis sp. 146-33]